MVNLNSHSVCKQRISNMAFCGTRWVGSNKKQMLLWGSSVLTGKAGANNSLGQDRKCLATPPALLHHIHLCIKVSGFMLTYWRFPPQFQPAVQAWMSYLLI